MCYLWWLPMGWGPYTRMPSLPPPQHSVGPKRTGSPDSLSPLQVLLGSVPGTTLPPEHTGGSAPPSSRKLLLRGTNPLHWAPLKLHPNPRIHLSKAPCCPLWPMMVKAEGGHCCSSGYPVGGRFQGAKRTTARVAAAIGRVTHIQLRPHQGPVREVWFLVPFFRQRY